ncbi:MAG: DeoR/GlpR family DNA-binding transcription regulator [Novibacillus thermophilus]|nr:DeoR/GlpR family DNA-binding transcription regulator [Novibacillus thermophilus]
MSKVFSLERKQRVLEYLNQHQRATVKELSQLFNVTEATLRSDLTALEKEGHIKRIHGGAVLADNVSSEYSFLVREKKNRQEKIAIGKTAADMVETGQCILLDGSTTCLEMARSLRKRKIRLTVITNGLMAAMELRENPEITVIVTGGILRIGSISLEGTLSRHIFNEINVDTAFLSARGFTFEDGLTDFNMYEVELKKLMVDSSPHVVALLDHSKMEKSSIASFAKTEQVTTLITDRKTPESVIRKFRDKGINVIVPSE